MYFQLVPVVGKLVATSLSFTVNLQYLLYHLSPLRQPAAYKQQIQLEISVQVHKCTITTEVDTCVKEHKLQVHSLHSKTIEQYTYGVTCRSDYIHLAR